MPYVFVSSVLILYGKRNYFVPAILPRQLSIKVCLYSVLVDCDQQGDYYCHTNLEPSLQKEMAALFMSRDGGVSLIAEMVINKDTK